MRYLTIVRHAEAEDAAASGRDCDRALTKRGRQQCEQLRALASDAHALGRFGPVSALVSGAARTRETFRRAFEGTDFVGHVEYSDLIYNGQRAISAEDVLIDLAAIDPVTTSLMVVGHNPTLAELVSVLARDVPAPLSLGRLPKAAVVVLALDEDRPIGLSRYEAVAAYRPR